MWFAVTAMMGNRKRYRRPPSRRELLAVAASRRQAVRGNRKGVAHTEETKAKVSSTMSKLLWWNNGVEQVRAESAPAEGFARGALARGIPNWSSEGKAKIINANKTRDRSYQRGAANVSHRPEVKAKISNAVGGKNHYSKKIGYVSKLAGDNNPARRANVVAVLSEKANKRNATLREYFERSGYIGNKRTVTLAQAEQWIAQND
jgi:hypothetical protein